LKAATKAFRGRGRPATELLSFERPCRARLREEQHLDSRILALPSLCHGVRYGGVLCKRCRSQRTAKFVRRPLFRAHQFSGIDRPSIHGVGSIEELLTCINGWTCEKEQTEVQKTEREAAMSYHERVELLLGRVWDWLSTRHELSEQSSQA
jgi:hypothetical protein